MALGFPTTLKIKGGYSDRSTQHIIIDLTFRFVCLDIPTHGHTSTMFVQVSCSDKCVCTSITFGQESCSYKYHVRTRIMFGKASCLHKNYIRTCITFEPISCLYKYHISTSIMLLHKSCWDNASSSHTSGPKLCEV